MIKTGKKKIIYYRLAVASKLDVLTVGAIK